LLCSDIEDCKSYWFKEEMLSCFNAKRMQDI